MVKVLDQLITLNKTKKNYKVKRIALRRYTRLMITKYTKKEVEHT